MNKIIFTLVSIFLFQFNYAQDEAFKKDALKLIEISGATSQMKLVKNQFIKFIPKDKQNDFTKDFEASLPQMYEDYAKVYMKLYTHEDIKAMITFYESPVGKKIYLNADEMSQRSHAAGQVWMLKLQDLVNKYKLP